MSPFSDFVGLRATSTLFNQRWKRLQLDIFRERTLHATIGYYYSIQKMTTMIRCAEYLRSLFFLSSYDLSKIIR
jgi:hypothetical protein